AKSGFRKPVITIPARNALSRIGDFAFAPEPQDLITAAQKVQAPDGHFYLLLYRGFVYTNGDKLSQKIKYSQH
ncbi:MAG: hypothetical protein ABIV42_06095, partial [Nitrosospira sp.]